MLLYVLALLLVHTDGRNIGDRNENTTILGNAIIQLANSCGNQLFINESRKIASECNLVTPPYEEKQLKCLMFYDISNQLCHVKPPIQIANYNAKISEKTNITSFCQTAAQWTVQPLPDYPEYKPNLDVIFKDEFECYKICSGEDLLSKDMNFYCKYYKWGMELLNAKLTTENTDAKASAATEVELVKPPTKTESSPKETQNNLVATNNVERNKPSTSQESESQDINVKPEPVPESSSALIAPHVKMMDQPPPVNPVVTPKGDEKVVNMEPMQSSNDDVPSIQNNQEKPPENNDNQIKGGVGQDPDNKIVKEDSEDFVGEEETDGLEDSNGADGDDEMAEDKNANIANPSHNDNPSYLHANVPVSIKHPEDSEKSIFPNLQDGYSDEDDHFFPFFLTVVILVVLLYVLYHNKSKVTKVVLGLLVEGRSSRARRGSRGHYRRLDTLEQALGAAPAPAAPTKIIY